MADGEIEDPRSFTEMLEREHEHLGRYEVGKVLIYRNVIKLQIIDECGDWVADLDIPTASLDRDLLRKVWGVEAAFAEVAAPLLSRHAADALSLLIGLAEQSSSFVEGPR